MFCGGSQECGVGGDRDVCGVGGKRAEGTPAAAWGRRLGGQQERRAWQRRGAGGGGTRGGTKLLILPLRKVSVPTYS